MTDQEPIEASPQSKHQDAASSALDSVPAQYRNLPSDIVEELWQQQIFVDPDKTTAEQQRRENAICALRSFEEQRALTNYHNQDAVAAKLSSHDRIIFEEELNNAPSRIGAFFRGEEALPISLAPHEKHLLDKMRTHYRLAKERDPHSPISFQFSRSADSYAYGALLKKIALAMVFQSGHTGQPKNQ